MSFIVGSDLIALLRDGTPKYAPLRRNEVFPVVSYQSTYATAVMKFCRRERLPGPHSVVLHHRYKLPENVIMQEKEGVVRFLAGSSQKKAMRNGDWLSW